MTRARPLLAALAACALATTAAADTMTITYTGDLSLSSSTSQVSTTTITISTYLVVLAPNYTSMLLLSSQYSPPSTTCSYDTYLCFVFCSFCLAGTTICGPLSSSNILPSPLAAFSTS